MYDDNEKNLVEGIAARKERECTNFTKMLKSNALPNREVLRMPHTRCPFCLASFDIEQTMEQFFFALDSLLSFFI